MLEFVLPLLLLWTERDAKDRDHYICSQSFLRRVWSSPATKAGGTHSPGGEGDGGVNILEDERNRIALLQ